MRITVLGGVAAFPTADQGCSGYLVEYDGMRLLVDPGYATLPRLLALCPVWAVDAVYVSHGHPDHCADLQPLLRTRNLTDRDGPALPVYAPTGSLDRLLAIDEPGLLDGSYDLREFTPGDSFPIGVLQAYTWLLPHWETNAGLRLVGGDRVLAYTGDTGPSADLAALADRADLLLADATHPERVPDRHAGNLSSAAEVGRYAEQAQVSQVLLTHLWPGTDPAAALAAAGRGYTGLLGVAEPGLVVELD
jgi:ribonuclease BN (tRNA processing enzyme)